MQNQYVGDIGDYIKFALLRALCAGNELGIAWYLFPDEPHKGDGRHTGYLDAPNEWRQFDPYLFDALREIVKSGQRNVGGLEEVRLFGSVTFANEPLDFQTATYNARAELRGRWFDRVVDRLAKCDVVFADPDNGPKLDDKYKSGTRLHWKSIPLKEILALANQRTAIIYFHNTRTKGGHAKENLKWLDLLPKGSIAIYCRATSCRTFLVVNPTGDMRKKAASFSLGWRGYVDVIDPSTEERPL